MGSQVHLIPRRRGEVNQPRGGIWAVIPGKASYYGGRPSLTICSGVAVPLRPGGFLDLGDQLLKGRAWPVFMVGQVDGGLSQAGEVRAREVLRRVGGEDLKGEVLSEGSDQFSFGCH